MFDAFDVLLLRCGVDAENRKKTGQRFVPLLNLAGDFQPLWGEGEAAIFFVLQVAEFAQFLHHARDGGLLHFQRGSDIDDSGVALLLD